MKVQSHRELIVWQKAMDLVVRVYALTEKLPPSERYRLIDQMSRAVVSVPANIAEGHERSTARDYANFLAVSKGSLMELETYLVLCVRLEYLTDSATADARALVIEISKMLTALRRSLRPA